MSYSTAILNRLSLRVGMTLAQLLAALDIRRTRNRWSNLNWRKYELVSRELQRLRRTGKIKLVGRTWRLATKTTRSIRRTGTRPAVCLHKAEWVYWLHGRKSKRCGACRARLSLGPSNDAPYEVRVEIGAAALEFHSFSVMNSMVRDGYHEHRMDGDPPRTSELAKLHWEKGWLLREIHTHGQFGVETDTDASARLGSELAAIGTQPGHDRGPPVGLDDRVLATIASAPLSEIEALIQRGIDANRADSITASDEQPSIPESDTPPRSWPPGTGCDPDTVPWPRASTESDPSGVDP